MKWQMEGEKQYIHCRRWLLWIINPSYSLPESETKAESLFLKWRMKWVSVGLG
jgi:hypothetical protein